MKRLSIFLLMASPILGATSCKKQAGAASGVAIAGKTGDEQEATCKPKPDEAKGYTDNNDRMRRWIAPEAGCKK